MLTHPVLLGHLILPLHKCSEVDRVLQLLAGPVESLTDSETRDRALMGYTPTPRDVEGTGGWKPVVDLFFVCVSFRNSRFLRPHKLFQEVPQTIGNRTLAQPHLLLTCRALSGIENTLKLKLNVGLSCSFFLE